MAKNEKSAVELAKLIRSQLAEPKLRIAVYPKARMARQCLCRARLYS
jgi:hypothetical protein